MRYGHDWKPYVSVGRKKANAHKYAAKVAKKQKRECQPIQVTGRTIAKSFWGKAWCDHVESLSDYANRLPRGRTYVRNGSVVDLVITAGTIQAIVAGSDPYNISIFIKKLGKQTWDSIKNDCSQSIDSLLDLLGGRLSDGVMQRLTDSKLGCFPKANQIEMKCSCPDWSECCKHLAAVMYGIGSRLDAEPELLFLLRGVDQSELINQAVSKENLAQELNAEPGDLAGEDLGAIFGIELDSMPELDTQPERTQTKPKSKTQSKSKTNSRSKKATAKTKAKKKLAVKKTVAINAIAKKKLTTKKASSKKASAKKVAGKRAASKPAKVKKKTAGSKPAKKTASKKKTKSKKKASVKKNSTAKKKVAAKKKTAGTKKASAKKKTTAKTVAVKTKKKPKKTA